MIDEQLTAARVDILRKRLSSYDLWASVVHQEESYSIKISLQLGNKDSLDTDLLKNIVKTEVDNMGESVDFFVLAAKIYTQIYAHYSDNLVRIRFNDNNNSEMLFQF